METIISTTLHYDGSVIIQRVKDGEFHTLRETSTDSGEIEDVNDNLTTIQTIVIRRKIQKITF